MRECLSMSKKHRMYFDESGDHSYSNLASPGRRYLALCGVMFEESVYLDFQRAFEGLKHRYFRGDPDEPIVLHREDMLHARGVFSILANPQVRTSFDGDLLALIHHTPFTAIVVVIDKLTHVMQYASPMHPYHYCSAALLECYCLWLGNRRGDVMGESRKGTEDFKLKAAYQDIYKGGTFHVGAEVFQRCLTSGEIKLKPKEKNIAGLQLADLLAHPGRKRLLARQRVRGIREGRFGAQVADILWEKLRKRYNGETRGWGEVFLGK